MKENLSIITDLDGSKIAIVNDVRFRSRRKIDWNKVEEYLKEYVGKYYEIAETSEKIYIGRDFPEEFAHSNDSQKLRGANKKGKANMTPIIGKLIEIATKKSEYPDFDGKHGARAQNGWYRYNTRFGLPVYNEKGELENYNIFSARMLVRCDKDGKLYLYDLVRTKKETSNPLEQ